MVQVELGWGPFSTWIFELGWGPFSNINHNCNSTTQKIHIYGAKMFIKRDRFLGKFKKGPPHIGEYDKKCILEESNKVWLTYDQPPESI